MPRQVSHAEIRFAALAMLGLLAAIPVHAQTLTRILDPAINAAPDSASAASWIDVDSDGDLDLFVSTWSSRSPNLLFLNNGLGVFSRAVIPALDASVSEAFGSSWADADNDGLPDLAVTASAAVARAVNGRVEVAWEVSVRPGSRVEIERSTDSGVWERRAVETVDGSRRVSFDEEVPSGATVLRYRLRLEDGGERVAAGEVEVALRPFLAFSLRAADENGEWGVQLALPRAAEVAIEVIDAQGRRALESRRLALPAGEHVLSLDPASALPAGLYWVRARMGGEMRAVRAVRLR